MQIPLEEFEQHIDETILKRGLSYFRNGRVETPVEIRPGEYVAIVHGKEDYTVKITLAEGMITDYTCNCPYDWGPVCKHVAAVLFELQQEELHLQKRSKTASGKKPKKRKTIGDKINELLEKVPHNDLKQFVRELSAEDIPFRNRLFATFGHYTEGETKGAYKQQVKSILRAAEGRKGYIDWSAARYVGNAVNDLLETARRYQENGNYKSAIHICTAVMETMVDALQYSDDSSGDIGGNIDYAFGIFHEIATASPPEEIREMMIKYCFTAFEKEYFEGWGWHSAILQTAMVLQKTGQEAEKIIALARTLEKREYMQDYAQHIIYKMLQKTRGEKEAETFMAQNISNPEMRKTALQKAFEQKDYDKVEKLAREGIEHDRKDKPGLVGEWYDWLLKAALARGNTPEIIQYARYLFIYDSFQEQDYYRILKDHVEPDRWKNFVEEMIREIKTKSRWGNDPLLAGIFIREAWWDRLLELLKEAPTLEWIETYEEYLKKDYARELGTLYADAVLAFLNDNVGRKYYQRACRYIRRIKKLGEKEKAEEVVAILRKAYPQRRALLEELDQV